MKRILAMLGMLCLLTGIFSLSSTAANTLGVVIGDVVNLRSGPGTEYPRVQLFKKGTVCIILGEEGDWYHLSISGSIGYMAKAYVSAEIPQSDPETGESLPETTVPEDALYGTVTGSVVNLRAGPGTMHALLGSVKKGDRVLILGEEDNWYKVQTATRQVGYMAGDYLKPDEPEETTGPEITGETTPLVTTTAPPVTTTPPPATTTSPPVTTTPPPATTAALYATVTANTSIRADKGTSFAELGTLKTGDRVQVLNRDSTWFLVKHNAVQGYVHSAYLYMEIPVTTTAEPGMVAVVTGSVVNLRAGAGTSYPIRTQVYKGDRLDVLAQSGLWYQVQYENGTAYIHGDYVTLSSGGTGNTTTPPETTPPATTTAIVYLKVTGSVVNLRAGAGTNTAIMGQTYQGTRHEMTGESGSWYQIRYGTKLVYIHKDYAVKENTPNIRTGEVTGSALNVRSGAGIGYSVVAVLPRGTKVEILSLQNGWYAIKTAAGNTGYVSATYLKETTGQ